MSKPTVSVLHDTRRPIKDGRYPVRIQVIFRVEEGERVRWVPKYFGKDNYCTVSEFATFSRPRSEGVRELKRRVDILFTKATRIIADNEDLTPEIFEGIFLGKARDTVNAVYAMKVAELSGSGSDQVGTSWAYESSLHSLMRYKLHLEYKRHKIKSEDPNAEKKWIKARLEDLAFALRFPEITGEWLLNYEEWMISCGRTVNTVAIHLRALRHVFNLARGMVPGKKKIRIIPVTLYPFDEYQIKSELKYKIALNDSELQMFKDFKHNEDRLMEARDYWFFSYYANGMNMADVAKLRKPELMAEVMIYDRKKTRKTRKQFKQILIPFDHELPAIVKRRGAKSLDPNGYVFPILDEDMSELQVKLRVNKFIKRMNQDLDRIGSILGITKSLTSVIARHTFGNRLLNATDGDVRMIQDGLGHSNSKTSENYKGSIYLEKIKKVRGEAL